MNARGICYAIGCSLIAVAAGSGFSGCSSATPRTFKETESGGTAGVASGAGGRTAAGGANRGGSSAGAGGVTASGSSGSVEGGDSGESGASGLGGANQGGANAGGSGGTDVGGTTSNGGSGGVLVQAGTGSGGASPLADGAACKADGDCAHAHCVDGVCCESTCTGCKACSNALTGQNDGKCAAVVSGQDPHSACTDETASKECGNDGSCDGAGACRKVSSSHVCVKAACSSDGKSFTAATTCNANGSGTCTTAAAQDCGGYPCTSTGCAKPCTTQSDCGTAGNYCDLSTGKCAAKKADGSSAVNTYECSSGIVADGVCCHEACGGCKACTSTLNGQATSTTGQCLPVKLGMSAPHSACASSPPCGMDGTCDGSGTCRYPTTGTACGTAACSGSTLTPKACDSAHACSASTSGACPNALVCASASACKTSCSADADCVSGYYCASGSCTAKKASGACTNAKECTSGYCVDGYCCNDKCDGNCQSCKQTPGTCKSVTTPRSSCGGSGTCGAMKCDGTHVDCVYPGAETACPNACATDWSGVMSSACNGSGACGAGSKSACNSDQYCNTSNTSCVSKLASSTSSACTKDIQCQSNTCCGSKCVNTSNDKSNCGACGTACASNQICSGSKCVCGGSTCGGSDQCGVWNFDNCSLDSSSWTLDQDVNGNAATGLSVGTGHARSGSCSLRVGMTSASGGAVAGINLHLCGTASNKPTVKGVQIWLYMDGTPTLNNVAGKGAVSLYNGSTFIGSFSLLDYPLSTGSYQVITGTFNASGPATDIYIGFLAPGYVFDGTVYIDDVSIF